MPPYIVDIGYYLKFYQMLDYSLESELSQAYTRLTYKQNLKFFKSPKNKLQIF